jgi:hypothetical protein
MNVVDALKETKNNRSAGASLPEWPKDKCIWYTHGSLYPDIIHRADGTDKPMALGEGIDADDLLRLDWLVVFR